MEKWWPLSVISPIQALLIGLGLVSMGFGGYHLWQSGQADEVEIIQETPQPLQVVVDVGGAVKLPGVYQLETGSRIAQALEKAGGFSDEADNAWIAKMINLAEVVKDGQKIYIPSRVENSGEADSTHTSPEKLGETHTINVNTASKTELENLWGVGAARSQTIIENRPYSTVEELKTKANVPDSVLEKNQGKISVY